MKHARAFAFLLPFIILCSVCMTFSSVSAAEMYFKAVPVPRLENGVITMENNQKWYRVRGDFEDYSSYLLTVRNKAGEELLLTLTDDDESRNIWYYSRISMTSSDAPRVASLTSGGYTLSYGEGRLLPYLYGSTSDDRAWEKDGSALCFTGNNGRHYLKYDADAAELFTFTGNKAEAAAVELYACANPFGRCIVKQPAAESYAVEGSGYPAPVFTVGLADVIPDSIQWVVDGELQSCTGTSLTADSLADQPAGIHSVQCRVTAHDKNGYYYSEQSAEAAFIIAKGVVPESVMTFSDVHEEYGLITDSIGQVMQQTGGYLPALVICTGDLVNGPTVERDRELNRYFPQIVSHLGGLDAVYVGGNHDSGEAASIMSVRAGLGAEKNLPAAGGVIFRGESEAVRNARSSRDAKSIITYGINYEGVVKETGGAPHYTYESVIPAVERFLQETAAQYHGELVIISAHAGLHVVGQQTDRLADSKYDPLYSWTGANMYNVDMSYELAETINRYAEQYNMDIMYIYGHNHSRGETEMFLTDGDTLICPRRYADRSAQNLTLHFTYAHAGYLDTTIGSAYKKFSFIVRDGDQFRYDLIRADGVHIRHADIPVKHPYEAPAETTAAPAASGTTAGSTQTTASATRAAAPETGDRLPTVLFAVPALSVLLICMKKRSRAE